MGPKEETDVRLTTTQRFGHVGICIFGKFHPCAEKSPIFVPFSVVAVTIGEKCDMKAND